MHQLSLLIVTLLLFTTTTQGAANESFAVLVLHSSRMDSITQADLHETAGNLNISLKLILHNLNATSCQEQRTAAISTFIDEIFQKKTDVVATVGPSCINSAFAISKLSSRKEGSMVHLHTSPMPDTLAAELGNSFGLLGSVNLLADASVALIQRANWTQVVALYQDTNMETNFMFNHLQQLLDDKGSNRALGYFSIVYEHYIPLDFVLSNYAIRVLFLMLDRDLTRKVLCSGYHLKAMYPNYQWVIFKHTLDDLISDGETYSGDRCSKEDLHSVLEQAIFITYVNSENSMQVEASTNIYQNTLRLLEQGLSASIIGNVSLNETLHTIKANRSKHVALFQRSVVAAVYEETDNSLQEVHLLTIPSNFTKINNIVNETAFTFTAIILVIQAIITALLQALTFYYRKTKSIRATSLRIQQLAYLGLYMIISSAFIYSAQQSVQLRDRTYATLCSTYYVLTNFGYTLLLGTLCVKAWRLYRIFRHYMNPGDILSDKVLFPTVLCLNVVSGVISILWIFVGKPERTQISSRFDFEKRVEITQDTCNSRHLYFWLGCSSVYHLILLLIAVALSVAVTISAPTTEKQFKRNEVILLTYIITITMAIGLPLHFLALHFFRNMTLEYFVVIFGQFSYASVYLILFFASPVFYAIKEQKTKKKINTLL